MFVAAIVSILWATSHRATSGWAGGMIAVLSIVTTHTVSAQLMSTCVPDSPERRGEIGCTIIQSKALPEGLTEPVFWHIDRFDSAERARAAAGPASIAFDAGGTWWLMTIERETTDHHGGQHVTHVGPLPLPKATKYAIVAQSAVFMPGMYSLVHHHSGVEAVYVVEGEACFETPTRAAKLHKGETLALPGDTPMRAVVTGTGRRHVLAVIVHDAGQPATMRMEEGTGPKLVVCK
jgi:quercetin dioxygenase-like cupin family protein